MTKSSRAVHDCIGCAALLHKRTGRWPRPSDIAPPGFPTSTSARAAATPRPCSTFLRENECETLYLVGDLIDVWSLRRSRYWPQSHNDVIQKILRKGPQGHPAHLHSRQPR